MLEKISIVKFIAVVHVELWECCAWFDHKLQYLCYLLLWLMHHLLPICVCI